MLPDSLPDLPGLDVAARYLPSVRGMDIGGDFYDLVRVDATTAAAVIGDVQGHNVSAAALMGRTRYTMRTSLRNALSTPVTVDVRQGGLYGRDSEIGDESIPGRRIDAYTQVWSVPVPANGEAVLTYSATVGG